MNVAAHQEAFRQVAKADAVMVSEALQRDFDKPLLAAAFPGWPVEAGFELKMEDGQSAISNRQSAAGRASHGGVESAED